MNALKYLIALPLLSLMACGTGATNNSNNDDTTIKPKYKKMGQVVDDIFFVKYPNANTNELTRQKALGEFMTKVDSLVHLNYLDDISLTVLSINKNPHGVGALVQFYANNKYSVVKHPRTDMLGFDIIGFMSEDLAMTIDNTKKYYVYAHNFKRLNLTEAQLLVNRLYNSPNPTTSVDAFDHELEEINIGVFLCEIDSVKEARY